MEECDGGETRILWPLPLPVLINLHSSALLLECDRFVLRFFGLLLLLVLLSPQLLLMLVLALRIVDVVAPRRQIQAERHGREVRVRRVRRVTAVARCASSTGGEMQVEERRKAKKRIQIRRSKAERRKAIAIFAPYLRP